MAKRISVLLAFIVPLILFATTAVADEGQTVEEETQSKQWNLVSEWSGSLFASPDPRVPDVYDLDKEKKKHYTSLDQLEECISLSSLLAALACLVLVERGNYLSQITKG